MVVKGKGLAARRHGNCFACRVDTGAIEIAGSIDKFAVTLHTWTMKLDRNTCLTVFRYIIDENVGAHMIDNALTIAAGVAYIITFVVGMAAQIRTIGLSAVEIANAFMVAYKKNPAPIYIRPRLRRNPHRRSDVAG